MIGGGVAGVIWTWADAGCGWSMRSVGWTARTAGCAPRSCPGRGRVPAIPAISRTIWLAQRTDRTSVATLMRCSWESVTAIIDRGVAELLDTRRVQTLYRIGVDEVCYRHPHQYLIVIGDHDTGTVVDIQPGRSEAFLANFYASQPPSVLTVPKRSAWTWPRPTPKPPARMSRRR